MTEPLELLHYLDAILKVQTHRDGSDLFELFSEPIFSKTSIVN